MAGEATGLKTAIIAGATGVVGYDLARELAAAPDWRVVGIARNPVEIDGVAWIKADLGDAAAASQALASCRDATHLFYCARYPHRIGEPEPVAANLAMLRNCVEPIEAAGAPLQHVHVVHGTKWYGSTLGPFPTPALEDDARHPAPNFYYAQQDYLEARVQSASWRWSTSRPHGLLHTVPHMPRSLPRVLAVYALICRALDEPLYFPGTRENFDALYQCTSTDRLARAIRFMATQPPCANQAFNVTNADYFRWSRIWPMIAAYFGMEAGPVRTVSLAQTMPRHAAVWDSIVARFNLVSPPFERLALWDYGDFIFTPGWDMMSDNGRLLRAGFEPPVATGAEILRHFDQLKSQRLIPQD